MAATMQTLSGARFVLGFGRVMPALLRKLGIPVLNKAGMADDVDILRRLWAAEMVSDHGPAGDYPRAPTTIVGFRASRIFLASRDCSARPSSRYPISNWGRARSGYRRIHRRYADYAGSNDRPIYP
jgi:alkanesulfonate monooxygenase SsuD/methylene tetrahydromethanopterin reductase-like flavin-dependent oxidoreductase (luciferase family)